MEQVHDKIDNWRVRSILGFICQSNNLYNEDWSTLNFPFLPSLYQQILTQDLKFNLSLRKKFLLNFRNVFKETQYIWEG